MSDGITTSDEITMSNAVIECILSRSAAKYYDPAATLSDDQIRELVRIGTTAPTSFHLQNWRFIAVRTPEAKARLSPIAWNQPPITDAAVIFIGGPRVRTGRGRSAGHAVVRRGGASGKLAAEAAPSGGRSAGIRVVEEPGPGGAAW